MVSQNNRTRLATDTALKYKLKVLLFDLLTGKDLFATIQHVQQKGAAMERLTEIQQVNSAIMFGDFTNDQLNSIIAAIKFRRAQITKQQTRSLRAGDSVKFTSSRNGVTYLGTVRKVKLKYVLVGTNNGVFNVPASMLEAV